MLTHNTLLQQLPVKHNVSEQPVCRVYVPVSCVKVVELKPEVNAETIV